MDNHLKIVKGEHGLYYGTSPYIRGLLITGESEQQVRERAPVAVVELLEVEIFNLRAALTQIAKQEIGDELKEDDCFYDFKEGYESCIRVARTALEATPTLQTGGQIEERSDEGDATG